MLEKASLALFSGLMILAILGCSSGPMSPQKPWTAILGDLVWVEEANIDIVYNAVTKTLEDMKFSLTKQQYDGLSGVVTAKSLENKLITIRLRAETADWTRVSIRVGKYLSDADKARVVYERIEQALAN